MTNYPIFLYFDYRIKDIACSSLQRYPSSQLHNASRSPRRDAFSWETGAWLQAGDLGRSQNRDCKTRPACQSRSFVFLECTFLVYYFSCLLNPLKVQLLLKQKKISLDIKSSIRDVSLCSIRRTPSSAALCSLRRARCL